MTFDMNNCVGDIAWAPYSSTVFAVRIRTHVHTYTRANVIAFKMKLNVIFGYFDPENICFR